MLQTRKESNGRVHVTLPPGVDKHRLIMVLLIGAHIATEETIFFEALETSIVKNPAADNCLAMFHNYGFVYDAPDGVYISAIYEKRDGSTQNLIDYADQCLMREQAGTDVPISEQSAEA